MNMAKQSLSLPNIHVPSSYSIYKRIANLALAVIAISICINLWLLSSEHAMNWHDKQANQLGRSLAQVASSMLAEPLIANDSETMSKQLEILVSDRHVSGTALYNYKGQLLDERKNGTSVLASYRLESQTPLVFVQDIRKDGQIHGYLRLMLNKEKVMEYHDEYQEKLFQQIQVLMLLAAAVAILITRVFYKFRYRKYIKAEKAEAITSKTV
jgi:membrane protein